MKKALSFALALALLLPLGIPALAFDAQLSAQNLSVNGKTVDCEKYNIDGSNYFKLRDLAYLLNGTDGQFDIGWDGEKGVGSITTNHAYTAPSGTELMVGVDQSASAVQSAQTIMIDGVVRTDLTVFNIGGSNFFKLREMGDALGFSVGYDADTNTATVTAAVTTVEEPKKELVINLPQTPVDATNLSQYDFGQMGVINTLLDISYEIKSTNNQKHKIVFTVSMKRNGGIGNYYEHRYDIRIYFALYDQSGTFIERFPADVNDTPYGGIGTTLAYLQTEIPDGEYTLKVQNQTRIQHDGAPPEWSYEDVN